MESLFNVLLPVISGSLATLLMTWLKKGVAVVGKLPATVQQIVVAAGSWGLVKLSLLLTVSFTTYDVTQLASVDVLALSAAGLSFLFHTAAKKTTPTV